MVSIVRDVLAVILGGAIGTALRLVIDLAIPHSDTSFPFSTLAVNTVGAFTLAVLVARVWSRSPSWVRAGLGAGLLGSFTTFSAVAVAMVTLTLSGEWMLAVGFLVASILMGLGAAALGLRLGYGTRPPLDLVDE